MQAGPEGTPAGEVAAALGLPPNPLTFHFDRLREAGLVTVRREGRSMIYAARYDTMNALLTYLTENCCGGQASRGPAECQPVRKRAKIPAWSVLRMSFSENRCRFFRGMRWRSPR